MKSHKFFFVCIWIEENFKLSKIGSLGLSQWCYLGTLTPRQQATSRQQAIIWPMIARFTDA